MRNITPQCLILILGLTINGTVQAATITEHFDTDPGWTSFNLPNDGNDFGFRNSNYAGGDAGEVGGLFSRTDEVSWYGDDNVGVLGEDDAIQASGLMNIRSVEAGYNNNTHVGHFDSDGLSTFVINGIGFQVLEQNSTSPFSFRIFYTIGSTEDFLFEINGVDESRNWSYLYDPNDGDFGSLTVSISGAGGDTAKRFLTAGQRASIGNLNVFGLAEMDNSYAELPQAEIYVDDVTYTVVPIPPTMILFLSGASLLLGMQRRRASSKA